MRGTQQSQLCTVSTTQQLLGEGGCGHTVGVVNRGVFQFSGICDCHCDNGRHFMLRH